MVLTLFPSIVNPETNTGKPLELCWGFDAVMDHDRQHPRPLSHLAAGSGEKWRARVRWPGPKHEKKRRNCSVVWSARCQSVCKPGLSQQHWDSPVDTAPLNSSDEQRDMSE
jgi:hypothetical protein